MIGSRISNKERVASLVSGYPSRLHDSRLLGMFQVYADESGKEPPVFIMAAFMATPIQWQHFTDDWDEKLKEPPAIKYLHMREAYAARGEFLGWTDNDISNKLIGLITVINEHVLHGIFMAIDISEYWDKFKGRVSITFDQPYFFAATQLMFRVFENEYASGRQTPIEFIFDEQVGQQSEIVGFWSYLKRFGPSKYRRRMGRTPIWDNDIVMPPLQAADILSWTSRRITVFGEDERLRKLVPPFTLKVPIQPNFTNMDVAKKVADGMVGDLARGFGPGKYETGKMRSQRRKSRKNSSKPDVSDQGSS